MVGMVHYVDDHIVAFYEKALRIFLEATKGKVHAILIGDDVGSQRGLMISPKLISEFVIPGAKRLIEIAHSYGVKIVYHSCGSIVDAIPLLIEAGVDVIHPIQALAAGMDLGEDGYDAIHIDGHNLIGQGWIAITTENVDDFGF